MRGELVLGERPSALQRVLAAADSGNGVSTELPPGTPTFINAELTVHLFAELEGDWVCLDSRTRIGPNGVGLASTALYDSHARVGAGHQALVVRKR